MIYVPVYDNVNCAYVYDANRIRVYDSEPVRGTTIGYIDYYFDSHYLYTYGESTFSNYSTLPVCLSDDVITTNIWYRNDLSDILICLFIMLTICYFIIKKIIRTFFWGGRFA